VLVVHFLAYWYPGVIYQRFHLILGKLHRLIYPFKFWTTATDIYTLGLRTRISLSRSLSTALTSVLISLWEILSNAYIIFIRFLGWHWVPSCVRGICTLRHQQVRVDSWVSASDNLCMLYCFECFTRNCWWLPIVEEIVHLIAIGNLISYSFFVSTSNSRAITLSGGRP